MNAKVAVLGAGAFGTSLAISLSRGGQPITLWARDPRDMQRTRENKLRLPGYEFPGTLNVTGELSLAAQADILLLVTPTQSLAGLLRDNSVVFQGKSLITCCKGVDLATGLGPVEVAEKACPTARVSVLSGPGFAADIASGLPTALTLATHEGTSLQAGISSEALRIYHSNDRVGVALGGALKNIIAIACGLAIGAGLGESARAALLTRGFAEMSRFATYMGAKSETLAGLSGLGDLVLTATSLKSRNYAFGYDLGRGHDISANEGKTVEGMYSAKAVSNIAKNAQIDMPITHMVVAVLTEKMTIEQACRALLARPLKEE